MRSRLAHGSPWVVDSTLAVVFLVIGQVQASVVTTDGFTGGPVAVSRLVAAVVALSLVVRRAAPRVALGVCCAGLGLPSLFVEHDLYFWSGLLPVMFVVFPLARSEPGWLGRWGWSFVFVAAISVMLHDPASREPSNLVFLAFMLGTTTLAGRVVRRGALTRASLAEALAQLEVEHRAAEEAAVRAERTRIAAEVHDVVAHAVGEMQLQIGAARLGLEAAGADVPAQLREAEATGRRAMAELRHSVGVLDSGAVAPLEPLPTMADLRELVGGFHSAGLDVRLELHAPDGVPVGLQLTVFRLVQEALTNALKHGGRDVVTVCVREDGGEVRIEVRSPQSQARTSLPSGGHGLIGIRERVAMFDGVLATGPEGDQYVVSARLPVPGPLAAVTA